MRPFDIAQGRAFGRAQGKLAIAVVIGAATSAATAIAGSQSDVAALLARMGERVERYFARAQSIVCTEIVVIEPLSPNFLSEGGHARELMYELRMSWSAGDDGGPRDVKLLRELLRVDGRPPRPSDEPECADPEPVATEPLVMLLPGRQHEYVFTRRGTGKTGARESVMLDYLSLARGPADVRFEGDCVSVSLPGRSRGRIWTDASSGDVLRLDSQLIGTFEFEVPQRYRKRGAPGSMAMERADTSIRYHPVTFTDPDETLILPTSVRTTTVFRNAPSPRMRMTQRFLNYRRFITGGKLVGPD
jgi:hypothetical protein